ncbi:MAG: oligosaccharide flippase family protein [Ignavibacteria bacterium]
MTTKRFSKGEFIKDLIKSTSKLSVSAITNVLLSIARTKIIAISIGVTGLGVLSQFYNISGLLSAIIPIGTMGLLKYFSEYTAEKEYSKVAYLLKLFTWLNLPIVLLISVILLVYSNELSIFLFKDSSYSYCFVFYAIAVPLSMFASLTDTYFRGIRDVKKYVLYSILNSTLSFIFFIWLLLTYGIIGAIVSISISCIVGITIGYLILKKNGKLVNFKEVKKIDNGTVKIIVKLGLVMMLLVAIQQLVFLFIRSVLATNLGLHEVGIFQSVYGISNNYFALFLGVLGTYSIPLISTHKAKTETVEEINRTLKLLLLVYTPLVMVCFSLRYIIIAIFYTSDFFQAADILFYQLLGDFTKAISWVFGLWLIPYFKTTFLMIFEIINNLVFVIIFYYLLIFKNYGIESVSIAYLAAFIIHMILNFYYLRAGLSFTFMNNNLKSISISCTAILCIFLISKYYIVLGYVLLPFVMLIWLTLVIKKNDLLQLKSMFLAYVKK